MTDNVLPPENTSADFGVEDQPFDRDVRDEADAGLVPDGVRPDAAGFAIEDQPFDRDPREGLDAVADPDDRPVELDDEA